MCRSSSALKDLNGGMCFGVAEGTVRCDFVVNASQVGVQVFRIAGPKLRENALLVS